MALADGPPSRAGGSTRQAMTRPRGLITARDDGPGCGGEVWLLHFVQNQTCTFVEEIRGHSSGPLVGIVDPPRAGSERSNHTSMHMDGLRVHADRPGPYSKSAHAMPQG